MRPSGIVFDCYGTLVTIREDLAVTRRAMACMGRKPGPSPMIEDVGLGDALVARGVAADTARSIATDALIEAASATPLPGALEIIALARSSGIPVAIASNLSREYDVAIHRHFPSVPAILSFEMGALKPDSTMFSAARRALGDPEGRIVMIGDSLRCDHDGAIAAGFDAILIRETTRGDVVAMPDMIAVLGWLRHTLEGDAV